MLLANGADPNVSRFGDTALIRAVEKGHVDIVMVFLGESKKQIRNTDVISALRFLDDKGENEFIGKIISEGKIKPVGFWRSLWLGVTGHPKLALKLYGSVQKEKSKVATAEVSTQTVEDFLTFDEGNVDSTPGILGPFDGEPKGHEDPESVGGPVEGRLIDFEEGVVGADDSISGIPKPKDSEDQESVGGPREGLLIDLEDFEEGEDDSTREMLVTLDEEPEEGLSAERGEKSLLVDLEDDVEQKVAAEIKRLKEQGEDLKKLEDDSEQTVAEEKKKDEDLIGFK